MKNIYKEGQWATTAYAAPAEAGPFPSATAKQALALVAPVHLVLVLGVPGVGKTAVIQHFLHSLGQLKWKSFACGLVCGRIYSSPRGKLFVLGSESAAGFSTDTWSMLASADMPDFVAHYLPKSAPCTVLADGLRCLYSHLLEDVSARQFFLSLVELEASADALASRLMHSPYNPVWAETIKTRLKRLCRHYAPRFPYYLLPNEHEGQLGENVQTLWQIVAKGADRD